MASKFRTYMIDRCSAIRRLKKLYDKVGLAGCTKHSVSLFRFKKAFLQGGFQVWLTDALMRRKFQLSVSRKCFTFDSNRYKYFYHTHGNTWRNERAIEVPIVYHEAKKHDAHTVLEVGNVLSHYYPVAWDVIDRYERAPLVTNVDVSDFSPAKKYDLIISISTLEHVGFDEAFYQALYGSAPGTRPSTESHQSAEKILLAISRLKRSLSADGKMLMTVPLGYNVELDQLLSDGALFTSLRYMKRISRDNRWAEVQEGDISDARYHHSPFQHANIVVVCSFRNKPSI